MKISRPLLAMRIIRQSAVAHLGEAEGAFDDGEAVLAFGANAGSVSSPRFLLVGQTAVAAGLLLDEAARSFRYRSDLLLLSEVRRVSAPMCIFIPKCQAFPSRGNRKAETVAIGAIWA
ncbi:MAG: hypothetical protein ABI639_06655 [Thermoanaerobaculia bacterium]